MTIDITEEKKYTLLDALIMLAPKLKMVIPLDISVTVTDTEKILVSYSADIAKETTRNTSPTSLKGKLLTTESAPYKAIKSGKLQEITYPKELYGVPFKSFAVPIEDGERVIGCLAVGSSLEYQEKLMEAVRTLMVTNEEIIASTEELVASSEILTEGINFIDSLRKEMDEHVKKTQLLLDFIKKLASNSNLLGLNASIEAARAGNEGRGFQIVASEIRKMADDSTKSAEDIKKILEEIQGKVKKISHETPKSLYHSQQQTIASKEIVDAILSLNSYILDIEYIANKL